MSTTMKGSVILVRNKVHATYTTNFSDDKFLDELPNITIDVPDIPAGIFRAFEIEGNSMSPKFKPGLIVIGELVEEAKDIKDMEAYIIVHKNGLVLKRISLKESDQGILILKSDNTEHQSFTIDKKDVIELWRIYKTIDSFESL